MKKLNCIVCDNPTCCKVILNTPIFVKAKKKILHYCSEKCKKEHYIPKHDHIKTS